MTRKRVLATALLLLFVLTSTGTALAQSGAIDRPAAIRNGTCDSLGDEVATLANLVLTQGDPQGQAAAVPVEQSGTVVPFTIDDLLAAAHVVIVQKSAEESGIVVACGEIGGVLNPDGTLAVGMLGVNGSGLSGVSYFTPIDTFQNTLVTILLVGDSGAVAAPAEEAGLQKDVLPAPDQTGAG